MLGSGFREKGEKLAKLPLSTEATNQLIKFLYGFELEAETSLEAVMELIYYGGVCGVESLRDAAGEILKKYLNKENVFEVLKYCKKNEAKVAVKSCSETIVNNFDKKFLLESGHLEEHPEVALEIVRKDMKPRPKPKSIGGPPPDNILFCFDTIPKSVR